MIVAAEQPDHPNQTHREYLDPPWPTIEAEIRGIDGHTRRNLWIEHIDEAVYDWCRDDGDCTRDNTSKLVICHGTNGHDVIAVELMGSERMTGHRQQGPTQPWITW